MFRRAGSCVDMCSPCASVILPAYTRHLRQWHHLCTTNRTVEHTAQRSCIVLRNRVYCLYQCFSTAGPRPGTRPWHQLYRTARGSPGICHFSFL